MFFIFLDAESKAEEPHPILSYKLQVHFEFKVRN